MTHRAEPPHVVDPAVLESIDERLIVARRRQNEYEDAGDARSAEIQEDVIDRLLRERFEEAGQ